MHRQGTFPPSPNYLLPNTVRNTSRPGIFVKLTTAKAWVKQCVCEWVVRGYSIRELSTQERLERIRLNLEAYRDINQSEPAIPSLPGINTFGLKEEMPRSQVWGPETKFQCLVQAREFYAQKCSENLTPDV